MSVVIPDDILTAAKMSEAELKLEIAILLYQKSKISTGTARRLAGMNLIEFQKELASRGICVNYDVEDLQADIKTLQELGQL
jgi:predicted HTH domain antitoxin